MTTLILEVIGFWTSNSGEELPLVKVIRIRQNNTIYEISDEFKQYMPYDFPIQLGDWVMMHRNSDNDECVWSKIFDATPI